MFNRIITSIILWCTKVSRKNTSYRLRAQFFIIKSKSINKIGKVKERVKDILLRRW